MCVEEKPKKEREWENNERKKERRDVFKCPPTKSTSPHLTSPHTHAHTYTTIHISHFTHTHTSLKLLRCQKYPSATPQKIPIFITTSLSLIKRTHTQKMIILLLLLLLKYTSFFPNYVGFLGFVLVRAYSQRKQQTKPEPSHPPIINTPLFSFSLFYVFSLPFFPSLHELCSIISFLLSLSLASYYYYFFLFFLGLINILCFIFNRSASVWAIYISHHSFRGSIDHFQDQSFFSGRGLFCNSL